MGSEELHMVTQRTLLRLMLWTLGLAAAAGIFAIFFPGRELTGRLFATGILTAVATAIAMPAAKLSERPERALRDSGFVSLWSIVISYLIALLAIWISYLNTSPAAQLALTAFASIITGSLASSLIAAQALPLTRPSGRFGLAITAAAFCLVLTAIWRRYFNLPHPDEEKCMMTVGQLLWHGLAASICLIGFGADRWHLRWIGIAASAGAFASALWGIWIDTAPFDERVAYFALLAAPIAHANLITRVPLPPRNRWLTIATVLAVFSTAAGVAVLNYRTRGFTQPPPEDLLLRSLAALGIASGCGTLAIIILYRFNRRLDRDPVESLAQVKTLPLACPACGKRQNAPLGVSGCTGCGLMFSIRVYEPTCPACNYSTRNLAAPVCPECGAKLPPRGVALPLPA